MLKDVSWKIILKDVGKFYAYLLIFYILAFFLVWFYMQLTIESFLDSESFLKGSQSFNTYNETLELLSKMTGSYMFIVVCFGVFFSIPPKKFEHIAIVTILISLTANFPFFYKTPAEWFYDNVFLLGCILIAWLCSLGWHKFRSNMHGRLKF